MASTADIQVRASRGRTTQELHRDALRRRDAGKSAQMAGKWDSRPRSGELSTPACLFTEKDLCVRRMHQLCPRGTAARRRARWTRRGSLQHCPIDCDTLTDTYIALLAVVADKAVVDTTPHLAHLRVNPVCGSLICLRDTKTKEHDTPPPPSGVLVPLPTRATLRVSRNCRRAGAFLAVRD